MEPRSFSSAPSADGASPRVCSDAETASSKTLGLSTVEFVVLVAGLMALNALAIDIMLPALGLIAEDLGVARANDQQLVVICYVLGFGAPQLVFGPMTDRYGRRPVLFVSLVGFVVTSAVCIWSYRFDLLLIARFAQGVFAAGARVVAVAVVRDATSGTAMARIMSLVLTVFMVVPIVAPSLGQLILYVGPWQWCFGALALAGSVMLAWSVARLPESTAVDARRQHTLRQRAATYRDVVSYPVSVGYMLAGGCMFGALFAFISTSEQLFRNVFEQGDSFALWFAGVAFLMSMANLANSRLVLDVGARALSHGALVVFVASVALGLIATLVFGDHLYIFYPSLVVAFTCFGLVGPNFSAIAMEPLGRIAGTGSAAFGFVTTTGSGLLGGLIGRAYDGTTVPILIGFLLLGLASLSIVYITERGRLFGP